MEWKNGESGSREGGREGGREAVTRLVVGDDRWEGSSQPGTHVDLLPR